MQGGHGYGGYGYDAGEYSSAGGYCYSNGYDPAPAAPPAYGYDDPLATAGRSAHGLPAAALDDGLELQPSEACPRNYVIFDQTRTGSSVTFHPTLAHKLVGGSPSSPSGSYGDSCYGAVPGSYGGGSPLLEKGEDSEEIDSLLQSSEEEDDVASTGRAPGCGGSSPESSACSSAADGRSRKKERIRRMVRALKGVVPGGKQMDTPAVLDEAVWYLKSLKLEAATKKKLGTRGGGSDS